MAYCCAGAARCHDLLDDMGAHLEVQLAEALGIAPAQIRLQHLAHQVMRKQAEGALLDKGKAAQPLKRGVAVLLAQAVCQQAFVGGEGVGAHLQRLAQDRVGHLSDKALQQHAHDVGVALQIVDVQRCVLFKEVGGQRQRQRMAVGHIEDAVDLRRGHALAAQIGLTLVRTQVAQRNDACQRVPTVVGAPGGRRRLAAGHDHDRALRQLG